MTRFFLIAMVWICVSFAMLWWVQAGVNAYHRTAAAAVGRAAAAGPADAAVPLGGSEPVPEALAEALRRQRTTPEDLVWLELDRREMMRRLRAVWLALTLAPVLAGGWWAAERSAATGQNLNPSG